MAPGAEREDRAVEAAAIPAQRESAEVSSAEVLRGYGLDALVELIEGSGFGVCVTGEDHTWDYVNPAAARAIGRPLSELRGRDYLQAFPEHERAALLALEGEQREGDTGFYTNTLVRPDGTEVEMTWSGSVMRVGERELAPAVFHETSGVRRAHVEAASLGAVAGRLAAGEPVTEVLGALVAEAVAATRAVAGLLLVEEPGGLRVAARCGLAEGVDEAVARSGARLVDLPSGPLLRAGGVVHFSDDGDRISASPRTATWPAAAGVAWHGAAKAGVRGPDGLVGCLVVLLPASVTAPDEVELTFWAALADSASVALGNDRLRRQVHEAAAHRERERIARDLHDSVSQALFSVHARAAVIRRALDAGEPALVRDAAADLELLSRQALAEMRELLVELRPGTVTENGGLARALEVLAASVRARDGLAVQVRCAEVPGLAPDVAEHLYRIAREGLHNAVKHASATVVVVEVAVLGVAPGHDEVVLTVSDDGCGFDPAAVPRERYGQRTMRERAELCGGQLAVHSAPGAGTSVVVRVPLPRP